MRVTRVFVSCYATILFGGAAFAQPAPAPAPTRTVDYYTCRFANECDQQKATDDKSKSLGAQRGFNLSPAERSTPAGPRQSNPAATSIPSRASVSNSTVSGGSSVVRPAKGRSSASAKAMATQERRADLRLSFLLGSAQLTSQAQAEARVFAQALQTPQLADKRFLIEGHTDSSGSRALNLDLSKRRAAAVVDYLTSLGVGRDRLDARGYGPDRPLPGRRPSSPDNRRVEAKLL
jgi:outer membrane protein OmpA-like peptidoglycan-associated protein